MTEDYLNISTAQLDQYRQALRALNELMSYKEMALQLVGVQVTDVYLQNFVKGSTGKKRRDKRVQAIIEFIDQNGGIEKILSEPESEYSDPFKVISSIKKASRVDLAEYEAPTGLYLGIRLNPHDHKPQALIMCLGSIENYYAFTLHYYGRQKLYGDEIVKQEASGIHYAMGNNKIFIAELPHSQFLRKYSEKAHLLILSSNLTRDKSTYYMTGYNTNSHAEFKLSPICFARIASAQNPKEKHANVLTAYQAEIDLYDSLLQKEFDSLDAFNADINSFDLPIDFKPLIDFIEKSEILRLSDFHERMKSKK